MPATALFLGAALGLGLYLVGRGWAPRPEPLARVLALAEPGVASRSVATRFPAGRERRVVEGLGVDLGALSSDLAVVGRSPERHARDKLALAWVFATAPLVLAALGLTATLGLPLGAVALASLGGGVVGFVVPDLTLRSEAEERRREFRFALGSYLELAVTVIAAGGGIESALVDAAEAGDNWAHRELREALSGCRLSGESPWDVFTRLGTRLGVPELVQAAATARLAGEQGARVRDSLNAMSASMRQRRLAEVETEAQANTERLSLPVVLMLFGFLVFVAYPALDRIVIGL